MTPMNIYSQPGTNVCFAFPSYGYPCDRKMCREYLMLGATYTVDRTIVSSSHTTVFLKEHPGVAFNSVNFAEAK